MSRTYRNRRGNRGRRSDMNITPLVDVAFTLLIIFMITAPMLTMGVSVDLPEAETEAIADEKEPLTITVTKNGAVYIQETQIELATLQPKLVAITDNKKDTRLLVRGDKGVNYGRVMEVIGVINQGGFNKIALLTALPTDK